MDLKVGDKKITTELTSALNDLQVEITEIEQDDEGVAVTVKLLQTHANTAYRIGDEICIHPYELR